MNAIKHLRNNNIVENYFETLKNNPSKRIEEIFRITAKSSAPMFYVTFENARRFISLLMRGKRLPVTNSNKRKMYMEIYRRYRERVKDSDARYKYLILEDIIKEPAPSFYLNEETIRQIVYTTLRKP